MNDVATPRTLSTAEVSRLLGMGERQVRQLVRSGLGRPARRGRRYAFDFQDLVVLRTAHALMEADVPAARVRRALAALARQLPDGKPISGVSLMADGRDVVVRDGASAWRPESGQALLDFEPDDLADRVRAIERRDPESEDDPQVRARCELEKGLDLEDEDPEAACDAYGRAVSLDPDLIDAYVNLGRLAHEHGRLEEAAQLYHHALARTPDDPIVHFNLALVLEDASRLEAAARHYEQAIALDADFADAHYNLAATCERLGREADAIRHYGEYKRLTRA